MGIRKALRERVLFIGTQFSILYTSMYSPTLSAGCSPSESEVMAEVPLVTPTILQAAGFVDGAGNPSRIWGWVWVL